MEPRTIFIDAHAMRRHERVSALKECLAAVLLLEAGRQTLSDEGFTVLAAIDFTVGLFVLAIAALELARAKKVGSWVRWFDIAAGGLLVLAGRTLGSEGRHDETLMDAYYGLGVLYVLAGVFHRQLGWRRYVRLDDDGIRVRMTPLRRFRLAWQDISRVVGHSDSIEVFAGREGRYEISRAYIPNLDEIRDLILERASGRGIATK